MSTEEVKEKPPIAEVLIATGLQLAQEKEMTLGELIGHFEVAKTEVYARITAGAKAQASAPKPEPAGDADIGKPVAFSPGATEDTVEK